MPQYHCLYCGRPTDHVNVRQAADIAQVTRATVYNWLHQSLVHCVLRPSGRRFICVDSLVRPEAFRTRPARPAVVPFQQAAGTL